MGIVFATLSKILPEFCQKIVISLPWMWERMVRLVQLFEEQIKVLNIDAKDRKHFRDNMEFESKEEIINRVLRSNRRAQEHELLARTLKRKNNLVVALGSGYLTSFTPIAVWLLRLGAC